MQLEKQLKKKDNKGGRPQTYKDTEAYRSAKKLRDRSSQKEYQRENRANQREDAWTRMLEDELKAQYQLTKFLTSTCYVEKTTEVIEYAFKQDDDIFNQGFGVVVGGLDVSRRAVKDEADINMDGFQSDEDSVPLKDEVVREGKTT